MAWGTYMLRKPLVLVFVRFRVMARHHEELLLKGFDKSNRETSTIYYLLPTTYYLLPTTYYLLPTTYYLLLTTYSG
jgi:hypothetical protein